MDSKVTPSEYSREHCEHSGYCYAHNHENDKKGGEGNEHEHEHHHRCCCHSKDNGEEGKRKEKKKKTSKQIQKERSIRCLIMMVLTGCYMVAEIAVGIVTGSLALLGDGFHMMSDLLSLIVGFISIRISAKKGGEHYTFGYQRAEIVGGFANAVFLISAVIFIVIDAIERFIDLPTIENSTLMFGVAIGGLVINILGLFIFHEHSGHDHSHGYGHGHGHGHEHEHEQSGKNKGENKKKHNKKRNKKSHDASKSIALKGMFLHVLGDFLGSVAALASGLIITYTTFDGRFYFDPACSLLICLLIIISAVPLLKETLRVMMQASPRDIDLEELKESLIKIREIESVHELHTWNLGSVKYVAACHVVLTKKASDKLRNGKEPNPRMYERIQEQIENVFHNSNIHNTTVQIELAESRKSFVEKQDGRGLTEAGGQALCYLRRNCPHNEAWCCQDVFQVANIDGESSHHSDEDNA